MKKLSPLLALVAMICAATPIVAFAQAQYPPPTPTATPDDGVVVCFTVEGEVGGRLVPGRVDLGSDIIITGPEGTAETNGQIEFFIDDVGATLGEYQAFEDGSFRYTLVLPPWIKPGQHRIIGVIEGCGESRVDLEVLGAALSADDNVAAAPGSSGGSGVLPRTGISILSFVLVALILVGIGAFLMTARNRRRIRSGRPAHRHGSDSEVPLFDTGSFVPRASGQRPGSR